MRAGRVVFGAEQMNPDSLGLQLAAEVERVDLRAGAMARQEVVDGVEQMKWSHLLQQQRLDPVGVH